MRIRRSVVISTVGAVAAVALGVTGWLVYSNAQVDAAKDAYTASVADLAVARDAATPATDAYSAAAAELEELLGTAEELLTLLGEGGDELAAAIDATHTAREFATTHPRPLPPAEATAELPQNPAVEDYDTLRAKVVALTTRWTNHVHRLTRDTDATTATTKTLIAAWQTHLDTVPEQATAALESNPNASPDTKDAVTAAAEALTALTEPLSPDAVELWTTFLTAATTLADEEIAYQEEQAAKATRPTSGGYSGGYSGGGGSGASCQSAACYTGPSAQEMAAHYLQQLRASYAAEKGVPISAVHCGEGANPQDGSMGILCKYSTAEASGWHWWGIG